MNNISATSLDTLCAALCRVMGAEPPATAAAANEYLTSFAAKAFDGKHADRIFMYNPDAVAEWIYKKYTYLMRDAEEHCDIKVPFVTVMPSVTPVCFGTMYTGAQPSVHGIQTYTKPVIKLETLFDSLIKMGKKAAIVADTTSSMAHIFRERDMDYYIYDTVAEVNAKASELIIYDKHDFIAVYNGNYDGIMHKFGPESVEALSELRANCEAYSMFCEMICAHWHTHDTLVGFAMDHGCHEIDGGCGSHGLDMPEDLNIVHLYKAYPKKV